MKLALGAVLVPFSAAPWIIERLANGLAIAVPSGLDAPEALGIWLLTLAAPFFTGSCSWTLQLLAIFALRLIWHPVLMGRALGPPINGILLDCACECFALRVAPPHELDHAAHGLDIPVPEPS